MLIAFDRNETAGECVSAIIRAGLLPVAIEFMDRPCIEACEAFARAGYPDCEALLIVEVEGSEAEIAEVLQCSRGTVKSQASDAMRRLRTHVSTGDLT